MVRLVTAAAAAASLLPCQVAAFAPARRRGRSSSALPATPPPLIIGPMIRKMREEKEKKKMPMASPEESRGQAPGLRVAGSAWKWPPIWPYDDDFFVPTEELPAPPPVNPAAAFMGGGMPLPEPEEPEKIDPLQYWGRDKADVKTELDADAVAKLKSHYGFYLESGMSILEFGAAEDSYLPDDFTTTRHVGVGANAKLMEENSALTERLVVDLNVVVKDRDVDSDDLRKLALDDDKFDAILMANTIDFLAHPREVFRSAWNLLKPGGVMIVAFSTKTAYKRKFERAQTKMWRDFNDDQHMWICGSFFQFSAGEGWTNLMAFDASPDTAKDYMDDSPLKAFQKGKDNNLFIVQATKGIQDESIDEGDPEKSIGSKMWMLPTMEDRDKQLCAPRLARMFKETSSADAKRTIADNVPLLSKVYEALIKMDQFAFTFQMQSQLATDLVCNPLFDANEEQMMALRQGLGLRSPSEEFWQPIGENTAEMRIEDKINLLAYIVPRFGTGSPEQEEALLAFAAGLQPTMSYLKSKLPSLSPADVQLLGTELLANEILVPGRSSKREFAAWLAGLSEGELRSILANRLRAVETAKSDLAQFRKDRAEEQARQEELQRKYREQVEAARKERSMSFDPKTGKFVQRDPSKK